MEETSQNETLEGFKDEPDVVYEDVPDENELPSGWEDMLYDAWKEKQLEKEIEEQNKHSEVTK